jgi:integrase
MARVFIDDRWLKTAKDGTSASAAARRSLASAKDPLKARVPEKWRSGEYGRGSRWRARWYHRRADGSRIQKAKSFAARADADAFKAAMEDDVRRGRYHDPVQEQRLFRDVADEWIGGKLDIRPGTLGRYRREVKVYINPSWGNTPLRGFTAGALQSWVAQLAKGGYPAELAKGRESVPLSPRSIRNIVKVVMSGVFSYAMEQGWLVDNPLDRVTTPAIVQSDDDMVFLTIDEVESIAFEAGEAGTAADRLLVLFQAYVGPRINETLALRVGDLDLDRQRARISRTWADDGSGKEILGPPKSGKARTVAIPESLIEDLRAQVKGQADDMWVFRAKRGGRVYAYNWRSRIWAKALRNAGMEGEGITIHSLRHTYASIAIASGADVKTLQHQLGHASATITLNTYAALWPERLGEVADAVDSARSAAIVPHRARNEEAADSLAA